MASKKRKRAKSLFQEYGSDAMPILSLSIRDTAEQTPIPERFLIKTAGDRPAVKIIDTVTMKETTVPLFAYRAVRQVLDDLFS